MGLCLDYPAAQYRLIVDCDRANCLAVTEMLAWFASFQLLTATGSATSGRPRLALPLCVLPVR